MGPNMWFENQSKPKIIFCFLKIPSLISKDQKEKNIIGTMDDVRGDVLRPPHGHTICVINANIQSESAVFVQTEMFP